MAEKLIFARRADGAIYVCQANDDGECAEEVTFPLGAVHRLVAWLTEFPPSAVAEPEKE